MTEVTLNNVVKRYGRLQAVQGINLDNEDGEFLDLVGPSGCGKSTTLRMLAGLEEIYALYPHMTALENLGFTLRIAKRPEAEIEMAVSEAAGILGLEDLMDRRPAELSGGQRQRVAMGRAIVRHPDVFLFDEPLSNLDAKLRTQMRIEIKKLHQRVGNTCVYVTHDQVEAMTLADRIVLMQDGHIVQVGTPLELFNTPVNTFAATFIGSPPMNLLDGVVSDVGTIVLKENLAIQVPAAARSKTKPGQSVSFGFRADNLMPVGHAVEEKGALVDLNLKVALTEPLGTETLLFADLAGVEVQAKMFNPRPVQPGERMSFHLMLDKCHVFDAASGDALRE